MKKSGNKSRISNESNPPGFLVVLSAPSGCGKTTLLSRLLKRHPDWVRSISVTTRAPRPEEKAGEDYEFMSSEKFQELEKSSELLESEQIFGNFYGTRIKPLEEPIKQGRVVLLAIDIHGARSIRERLKGKFPFYTIFILPPSVRVLRERLENRSTDSPGAIEERIHRAEEEVKAAREYNATVVNHELDQTTHELETLIQEFGKSLKPKGETKKDVVRTPRKIDA